MPLIHLTTPIKAPIQIVFDLSRSIDFHQEAASKTREKAIAGRTSGLIELGETVIWEAVHFGIKQKLTSKIMAMEAPNSFTDIMLKGAFNSFRHEHLFYEISQKSDDSVSVRAESRTNTENITLMIDFFHFKTPLGLIGRLANGLFLKRYMRNFLLERNRAIKTTAEAMS